MSDVPDRLQLMKEALTFIADGVIIIDAEGRPVFVNEAGRRLMHHEIPSNGSLGEQFPSPAFRYLNGRPMPSEESPSGRALRGETVVASRVAFTRPDGADSYFGVTAGPIRDDQGATTGAVIVFRDITDRLRMGEAVRVSHRFLEITNRHTEMLPLLKEVVQEIRQLTDCSAVGIRILDEDGHIPYLAQEGFSEEFYRSEDHLCVRSDQGLCIDVVLGKTDASQPFYTEGGSFFANNTTHFLATTTQEERGQTRDVCNKCGYESLALIPIRLGDRILGLIHVADHREDMVPSVLIETLEEVAMQLGAAIQRVQATEALQKARDELETKVEKRTAELEALLKELQEANGQLVAANLQEAQLAAQTKDQAARMAGLLKGLKDGVTIIDAEGKVLLRNQTALELTGIPEGGVESADDYFRQTRLFSVDGQPLPSEQWPVNRLLRGEELPDQDYLLERADKSRRQILCGGNVVRDEDGKVALAILISRDVTEMRRLERLREEYVSLISHDLRQPLTAIRGMAEWLLRLLGGKEDLEREAHAAESLLAGARRMNAMIQELVDSARLESGVMELHPEPVDLPSLISGTIEQLGNPEERNRLKLAPPAASPMVLGDPDRLERVVSNLLTNALKYSPPGTPVIIHCRQQDDQTVVSVTDQGIGISAEDLPHIFERFYRTKTGKRKAEGFGLGLYISRLIVEAHGGRIWVDSKPGKGSTFGFSLPATV